MSWYFLGGFSAYFSVPSGRRWNHSGCSVEPRVVGRALDREVEAISQPTSRAARDQPLELRERPELGVDRRRARPPRRRSPTGCRRRRAPATSVLLRPLRFVVPIGWIGGQVDDVEAELGELRQHALDAGEAAEERGKSSYHAPNAPRSRSTSSSSVVRAASSRCGRRPSPSSASSTVSDSRAEQRRALGELARQVVLARLDLAPRAPTATRRRGRATPRRGTPSGPARRPRSRPRSGRCRPARAAPPASALRPAA